MKKIDEKVGWDRNERSQLEEVKTGAFRREKRDGLGPLVGPLVRVLWGGTIVGIGVLVMLPVVPGQGRIFSRSRNDIDDAMLAGLAYALISLQARLSEDKMRSR